MQGNNFTKLISHMYIRSIKIMVCHMRNIIIGIRSIASCLNAWILVLLDDCLGELDEFLTSCVHPLVVPITVLVTNSTLDVSFLHSRRHFLHIQSFHPFDVELASLIVEKQSLVWFFHS
jgi:hypothetical protein